MKIALGQMEVIQADFGANLERAEEFVARAKDAGADMLVLPEMFACGFFYKKNLQFCIDRPDEIRARLSRAAEKNGLWICASAPHLESGKAIPYNRCWLFDSSGGVAASYDKIHLFSPFNEDRHTARGLEVKTADTKFGKIGLAVCYDLRFPKMFADMAAAGAKLVIVCAAWPHPRLDHWQTLVKARAVENQIFIAAVNQCGRENFGGKTADYFGASQVVDPWGRVIADAGTDVRNSLAVAEIDAALVEETRAKMPSIKDRVAGIDY